MRIRLFIFFFFVFPTVTFCQTKYPQDYFGPPMSGELKLSGNFGEIRPNHFHAGFDLKTDNKEGIPIFAVADGYLARVKISPFGYGKALYINHSNGYTSVYAHLKDFPEPLKSYIKNIQITIQSFEIDTVFATPSIQFKKGDIIAFSGNTGGSQGPHLHFEIRETSSEKPVNPYLFGYKIKDDVSPKITMLAMYPLTSQSLINGKNEIKKIPVTMLNGKYILKSSDSIILSGKIGFAIECSDTESGSTNQNSVYSIELTNGGKQIYRCEYEKFSFENARYVNTHIDYMNYKKNNNKLQKCYLSKNNKIELYKNIAGDGIIEFNDNEIHWITFIVKDFNGNTSELSVKTRGKQKLITTPTTNSPEKVIDCSIENKIETNEIIVVIPAYALYDDVKIDYSTSVRPCTPYSALHNIHNTLTPLQKPIQLKIKTINLPDSLQKKACIVSYNDKGKISYEGGKFTDGYVFTESKTFGSFAVTVDNIAPKIISLFVKDATGKINLKNSKTISFKASDNLSGIKKYNLFIDNKWVVMEYEPKKELLFYSIEQSLLPGNHNLKIEVIDDKENKTSLEYIFVR